MMMKRKLELVACLIAELFILSTADSAPAPPSPSWTMECSAAPPNYSAPTTIQYGCSLRNTGDTTINKIVFTVTSTRRSAWNGSCPGGSLPKGSSMTCTTTYATTTNDVVNAANITFTLTATGDVSKGTLAPVSATVTVPFIPPVDPGPEPEVCYLLDEAVPAGYLLANGSPADRLTCE